MDDVVGKIPISNTSSWLYKLLMALKLLCICYKAPLQTYSRLVGMFHLCPQKTQLELLSVQKFCATAFYKAFLKGRKLSFNNCTNGIYCHKFHDTQ